MWELSALCIGVGLGVFWMSVLLMIADEHVQRARAEWGRDD